MTRRKLLKLLGLLPVTSCAMLGAILSAKAHPYDRWRALRWAAYTKADKLDLRVPQLHPWPLFRTGGGAWWSGKK